MAKQIFPQSFGKYILLKKVAMGGMAEIFRAKTIGAEGFEREVAIKRILPHFTEDENFVRMFIDEATIAAKLHHANIVQIFDFDKLDDTYYIAMEFIDGCDLKKFNERLRKNEATLDIWQAVFLTIEVAKALHYAHTRTHKGKPLNIVHRDVSPQNIMINFSGEVKLMDFGIAKAAERSTKTRAGTVKGKCAYMSPEQARGKQLDARSDLFALGVIIWETLTGKRVFAGETDFETLSNVLKCEVDPPSLHNPAIPPELDKVILKALSKDADDRYPNCGVFQRELSRLFYANVENVEEVSVARIMEEHFSDEIATVAAEEEGQKTMMLSEMVRKQRMAGSEPKAAQVEAPSGDQATVALPAMSEGMGSSDPDMQPTMPLSELQAQALRQLQSSGSQATVALPSADAQGVFNPATGTFTGVQPRRGLSPIVIAMLIVGALGVVAALAFYLFTDQGKTSPQKPPGPRGVVVQPVAGDSIHGKGKTHSVEFRVKPGTARARVFVNGKLISGLRLDNLKKGDRLLVYAEGEGRRTPEKQVVITKPKEIVELVLPMNKPPMVELTIVATGATIKVDGKVLGKNDLDLSGEKGKVVKIEADFGEGKVILREIRLGDVARTIIEKPEAKFGTVLVHVRPKESVVEINSVKLLPTDGTVKVPNLPIGKSVKLRVSAKHYETVEQEFVLNAERQELKIALERDASVKPPPTGGKGYLTINAVPWAYVIYKGKNLGLTPIKHREFPSGRVRLTLKHPRQTRTVYVTVKARQHIKRVFKLLR